MAASREKIKLDIIATVEYTTRNARKMKYYEHTLGDATMIKTIKDINGKHFLDGVEITHSKDLKKLNAAIDKSLKATDIERKMRKPIR